MHYDNLSEAAALRLEASSRELAMQALVAANREAGSACESDDGGPWRWNFGVYVYREEVPRGDVAKSLVQGEP